MIIDTHCHVGLFKYEPVESLLHQMTAHNVDKAVFIQYMGNTNNSYMLEAMNAHPGKFAAAMIVPADDDGRAIRQWAKRGIGGIRLSATFRGSGSDPLLHWRTAAELDLVVSAPCSPAALLDEAFREVVEAFPNLQIVIEHLAGVERNVEPPYDEFRRVLELARYPNLTIKLPGFGEFCDLTALLHHNLSESRAGWRDIRRENVPPFFAAIPPLAEMALEAFGADRMMWGSDFPPASTREGYENSLAIPQAYFSTLSDTEQAAIFGGAAARVWGL